MDVVTLLPLVLIFGVFYLFIMKPAKNRQREAAETQNSLRPGMEVRTLTGLYATVSEVEDDSVILEIAPDVHCRFVKGAIAAVLSTEHAEPEDADHETDADETDDDGDEIAASHTERDRIDPDKGATLDKGATKADTHDVDVPSTGDRLRKKDQQD